MNNDDNGDFGNAVIAYIIVLILGGVAALAASSCVQLDPVEIKQNANLTCFYSDVEVASCEMRLVCNGLEHDGKSVLEGNWKLCNKDNGVRCEVQTSSAGGVE